MEHPSKKTLHTWIGKFRVAFRGLYWGIAGQASFVVHFTCTLLVILLAAWFRVTTVEWALLVLAIGLVLTAELFNSCIETFFRGLPESEQTRTWPALDIAAGAVLVASLAALCIGAIIFLPRFLLLFD